MKEQNTNKDQLNLFRLDDYFYDNKPEKIRKLIQNEMLEKHQKTLLIAKIL